MHPHPARLLSEVRLLAGRPQGSASPDSALLDRYVLQGDQDDFSALVARHGPMVLGVCRRLLPDPHLAEDACQAAFLVLARKAAAVRPGDSLAAWLHGVARRVALKARSACARDRLRHARPLPAEPADHRADPLAEVSARELLEAVDEEVRRLPEAYRLPVLLCCLEGRTQEEAARLLGWTAGSVQGRLERGRRRLRERLARRGLTLSAALAAVEVSRAAAFPARLLGTLVGSGAGVSVRAAALAEAALRGMAAGTWKAVAALVLVAGALAAGAALAPRPPAPGRVALAGPPAAAAAKQPRVDSLGDPLPAGAVARLGTVRLRHDHFAFAFSPDGKRLASAGRDRLVRVWDTATGEEVRRLAGHKEYAYSVAFSPDGKLLASGDVLNAHLWDLATGRKLRTFPGFDGGKDFKRPDWRGGLVGIHALAFSPDGKTLAVGEGDRRISLWDVATGRRLRRLEGAGYRRILFLPGGKGILSANDALVCWRDAGGKELRRFPLGDRYSASAIALAPDGKSFVYGGPRYIIRGNQVVGSKGKLSLWDVAAGKERRRLDLPRQVVGVALSPDGKTLAYAQVGQLTVLPSVHLVDVATWKELRRIDGRSLRLAFSPDGKTLAGQGRTCLHLWDVATGRPRLRQRGHTGAVDVLSFTPDGKVVVSASREDGAARLWDLATGREVSAFQGDWQEISPLRADGTTLLSNPAPNRVSVWDTRTGKRTHDLRIQKAPANTYANEVLAMGLSPDGRTLTSVSNNNDGRGGITVLVREVRTGKDLLRRQERRPEGRRRLVPSPDSTLLAETDGATLALRDVVTGEPCRTLKPDQPGGRALGSPAAFSPDGRLVACAGAAPRDDERKDTRVWVWEVATGKEVLVLRTPYGPVLAFSRDGRALASAGSDPSGLCRGGGSIHLWDLAGGAELAHFGGHGTFVRSLAFAPDGKTLVSGLADSTLLAWDLTPALRRAPRAPAPGPRALARHWADLAGADAPRAHRAIRALAAAPGEAIPFLAERLKPADAVQRERLKGLIADLDGEEFAVRQAAEQALRRLDLLAEPALLEALRRAPPLEPRRRMERLMKELHGPVRAPEVLRAVRAVAVLEYAGTPEARRVLEALAKGAPEARLTREAKSALRRLERRPDAKP
jgi:RNA polymerase sigma factor (sigma-70 family)